MLVSIDWIKDFVDLSSVDSKEMINRFILSTAEIEGVEEKGKFFDEIECVKITKIDKHPDAEKLNLVTFQTSDSERQVVCGAGNVKVGLKVPFAKIGTTLPGNFTLTPKKIRGILSEGMLCSGDELGLPSDIDGLLELDDSVEVGTKMSDVFNVKSDTVLDIDNKSLTHRPDLWGHHGLAREFAAITGKSLGPYISEERLAELKQSIANDENPRVSFVVEEGSSCKAFLGINIEGVSVQDSPQWIKNRLLSCGINPKNSIVDISNYAMLETGSPNHIYDSDKINGSLSIKPLSGEASFTALDGSKINLVPGDTVISDDDSEIVLAGIIGGKRTGVSEETKNVFIEVANWVPSDVRKTSNRVGVRTDSSQRFEKTLDSAQCEKVLFRIVDLVLSLNPNAKVVGKLQTHLNDPKIDHNLVIDTSIEKINKVLGTSIDHDKISEIFTSLEFGVAENNGSYKISVPSFRATKDIEIEADLIEEVGRMIGYDNINPVSPLTEIFPNSLTKTDEIKRKIKKYLELSCNAYEYLSYPLVGESLLSKGYRQANAYKLINALSEDCAEMRSTLINSAIEKVALNSKNFSDFKLFEIGRVYNELKGIPEESEQLIIANFSTSKKSGDLFIESSNILEGLFASLGVSFQLAEKNSKFSNSVVDQSWEGLHPTQFYNVRLMGKLEGAVLTVHPLILKNFKAKGNLVLTIFNLAPVVKMKSDKVKKFVPLNKFPGSEFDFTVEMNQDAKAADVLNVLRKMKLGGYAGTKVVSTYNNEEQSFVTFRSSFELNERTLSSTEIKELESGILELLEKNNFFLKK